MLIDSESNSPWNRWLVRLSLACVVCVGAVALMLAWQNAELERELNALKREKLLQGVSVSPAASREQPIQSSSATAGTWAKTARTANATNDSPRDANGNVVEALQDQSPHPAVPTQAGESVPFLEALKASERAAKKPRNEISTAYPFAPAKQ